MTSTASRPADLTVAELCAAYRSRTLSPVEATRDALDRAERLNPRVNAFCLLDPAGALASARESERRWHRGEALGPVDGVPMSVKDLIYTAGWPTLRGSFSVDERGPWLEDAPSVARMREQGAVPLGKTTTPELGWKGVTDSPRSGVSGNPWGPELTCGGSSGGSASAVALGMGAASLGTDGGGSVRIPAGFSGIVALKPTYGRVPLYPASPFGTLAHIGPMTRTAQDAALLLDVVCAPDSRDPWALAPPGQSFAGALSGAAAALTGLSVAVSPTLGYVSVHPEVAAAFEAAVRVFADLGAAVEPADPGFADPVAAFHTLWFAGAAKSVERLDEAARARLDPGLAEVAALGTAISAAEYLDAMAVRNELGIRMGAFHERYPLLLTPTLPIPAFQAGLEVPPGWGERRWTSWTPFTYPFNLTQQPAASVPCGFTSEGLPIGLQIVGPRHADAAVLAAAHAYQRVTEWHRRRPPLLDE